jgi:hypothetical protein
MARHDSYLSIDITITMSNHERETIKSNSFSMPAHERDKAKCERAGGELEPLPPPGSQQATG